VFNHNEAINSNKQEAGELMTTSVAVATMKAAQTFGAGTGLRIVDLEIPEPGPAQVRIKVHACGVCHSDALVVEGSWPGIPYPRVPGR
jgi:alcohol dehydrogenase, propanol-preferring